MAISAEDCFVVRINPATIRGMDKLRALDAFVKIADLGSLTAAARALETSLPSVVRTLAALEAQLGARLFNRTTRRLALTDEGRRYLDHCRPVLAALDDADAALQATSTEPRGTIVMTAPVLFGHMHVAPVVTRFVARHPQVHCSVLLHDRVVDLLDEGIDVGIRLGALADSSLVARPLGHIRRLTVASPGLLSLHGTPTHPRELHDAPCIRVPSGAGLSGSAWGYREPDGRAFSVAVRGPLDFNHNAPAIEACAAGAGFGTFFSYQVAAFLQAGRLVPVLQAYEPPPRPAHIVYPHARLLPRRTRLFMDFLQQELRGFDTLPVSEPRPTTP